MSEKIARISATGGVEFIDSVTNKTVPIEHLSASDAAYLARAMLSSAVALFGATPPPAGTLVGDAHMPIMNWKVGTSTFNGEPVLIIEVPSKIELSFQMPRQGAKALGEALVAQGDGTAPHGWQGGTIH